jgi:uncharacterized protein with GYD domain
MGFLYDLGWRARYAGDWRIWPPRFGPVSLGSAELLFAYPPQNQNWEEKQMLFCLTATYTKKALEAMAKNPNASRREAVEQLITAAGGKLVAMYGTIADGPGAMVIFEADPAVAPALAGVTASSDGVENVKMQRLFSSDEVRAIRQKRIELQKSYRPPGQ